MRVSFGSRWRGRRDEIISVDRAQAVNLRSMLLHLRRRSPAPRTLRSLIAAQVKSRQMVSSYPSTVLDYMEWHICQNISQKYEEKGELAVCIEEIPRTIAQLEGSFPESDLSEPPPGAIEGALGCLTMDMAEDAEDALRRRLCNEIDRARSSRPRRRSRASRQLGVQLSTPHWPVSKSSCGPEWSMLAVPTARRSLLLKAVKRNLAKASRGTSLDYATPDDVMKGIEPYLTEDG
ncbi:hypothetical protein HD553DRAFT_120274 [Filobasidium floriforme]|uniref:uncharacterized protein n=1 Tax=Filobasidium floriforme TaxID=5210 RepID=UPI001E8D6D69|nr:uncharacterized protein HD553DRAFT_120274 [Filobasidium floriforme]KAH8080135.1 hypothetical protein HD553DRAFT_120274 [Filobasidium floriforme]